MSAPQIPNLLASRGSPRLRGSRGRGRGGGPARMDASQRKDLDIQSTDTDAAVSRLSAVSVGYLDDPFAPYFVNGPGIRRLPVINRGTYTRTSALDILVDAFLSHASDESKDTPTKQIISLGAGTDTRYFRLRAQNKHRKLVYHEFDFPSVCGTKSQLVSTNQALLSQDDTATFFTKRSKDSSDSDNESEWGFAGKQNGETDIRYCCHPLDLRRLPYTPSIKTLNCFHGICSDIPTLIISECCLCYLEVDNAQDVIKWFADRIPSLGIVLYEPIGVDTSFGKMMVANLASRNITMPTVKMYKALSDQKQRLSDAGFKATNDDGGQDAKTIEHIWENWINADEKERVDSLEGLDEVEEWQILARHYAVAWGPRSNSWIVTYVSKPEASRLGLSGVSQNGATYLRVDYWSKLNPAGAGRKSVRITSKKSWTHGLFVADIAHMPGGICGTWPAWWKLGPNWPNNGEIDIIEGVNSNSKNTMALHTSANCRMTPTHQLGTPQDTNCDGTTNSNAGCSVRSTSKLTYGNDFNAIGGGVYAMEWMSQDIKIWFFPRGGIPRNLQSGRPDTKDWGTPQSYYTGNCNIDSHFKGHNIVFDTTFCGDWAANVWSSDPTCSKLAPTCNSYVANNPSAFKNSCWSVNSVKVYTSTASSPGRERY